MIGIDPRKNRFRSHVASFFSTICYIDYYNCCPINSKLYISKIVSEEDEKFEDTFDIYTYFLVPKTVFDEIFFQNKYGEYESEQIF